MKKEKAERREKVKRENRVDKVYGDERERERKLTSSLMM